MLGVAIVGCGKVADQHVAAIRRVPNCRIVALCDQELLMAKQLGQRCYVSQCFSDVLEMLRSAAPQVVHITTPPQSHFQLARHCLEFGSHVYIEKPFTVTVTEAQQLIQTAEERGLKVTAGHNYQFTLEMMEMRRLVAQGFLGGPPVHVESYWSYDLGDISYVGPMVSNPDHWVRRLPGQLFHNLISHGLAKIVEFLDDDVTEVIATAHQSSQLRQLRAKEVLDELRVLIRDKDGTTAFFCFSTQIKGVNQLRVFGPPGSITADIITGTAVRRRSRAYKSYLTYFVPPLNDASEYFRNAATSANNFIRRRLYQDFGMKELIQRFYRSIRGEIAVPIPYREIILVARLMDRIFEQVYPEGRQGGFGEGMSSVDSSKVASLFAHK
jgi:predicted dehydrogenase